MRRSDSKLNTNLTKTKVDTYKGIFLFVVSNTSFVFSADLFLQTTITAQLKSSAFLLLLYRLSTFGLVNPNDPMAMVFMSGAEMFTAKRISAKSVRVTLCCKITLLISYVTFNNFMEGKKPTSTANQFGITNIILLQKG